MNKIQCPAYDDSTALMNLSNNPRVGSFPNLQGAVAIIQQAYVQYVAAGGNAFAVADVDITPATGAYLKAHYKSPPQDIEYITKMREDTEHLNCPMCGSFHRGTLDHLLPQDGYSAFAIFSLNLVPACKCNSKRQDLLTGANANERILHPYFDNCLAERLIAAHFEELGPVPKVGLRLQVDNTHLEYAAIDFHFRSIVERTAIKGYLRERWIDLCRRPGIIVRALKENPQTLVELRHILTEELDFLDDTHRSRNNWNSIFMAGLLDPIVCAWLFHQLQTPGRAANGPLI